MLISNIDINYKLSRKDAKALGYRYYFTGKPCINGHISARAVSSWNCIECWRERNHTDERRQWESEYRSKNKEERREKNKEYRKRTYYARQEYAKIWRKNNPEYFSNYRADKMERTLGLPEINDQIREVYSLSNSMRSCGEDVHVDHIIPLKGKEVSGLHVPWNLRIISAEDNLKKSNSLLEELVVEIHKNDC